MLSLTIGRFQEIIPKLMALQRGWFKHVRNDFGRFASLGTKRIGTWPSLTSPWVTGCPNMPLCLISLLTFYFLGYIPFHHLPLLFKWTRLWTWILQPLRLRSLQKGLHYSGGLCPWPWRICPLHNIETPYGMHTHEVAVTNLRWNNLMLVTLCISNDNLMILWTLLPIALSWGSRQLGLLVCWSCKELMDTQFEIIPKIVRPATCRTWILLSSRRLGFLHLIIHVRYVRGRTMLIKCCFAITIMVDTIFSSSSRSSLKFSLAIGTVHHVLLQHLDSYSDHAMFFSAQV